jgi:transcriptional regulator with XRE-family HTH domain
VGEVLRTARRERNVSLTQAAAATRIRVSFLEALEESDYSQLPGAAYVTGFLRNYAQYLGLSPDDVLQDYYVHQAPPAPMVKPATRVIADGQHRAVRKRLMWVFVAIAVMFAGAFAIKLYNDQYNHSYAAPLLVTPQNLGANLTSPSHVQKHAVSNDIAVRLRAMSPVWVRVTADGRRVFQGLLRGTGHRWQARKTIYVMTYDGSRLRGAENRAPEHVLSVQPGLGVWAASATGWHRIS